MKITNISDLNDGFGEIFKFVIYAIFYCDIMGHEFFYSPISNKIQHNYDNDIEFIKKKEDMINLIGNYNIATKDCITLGKFQYISFFEKNVHLFPYSQGIKHLKFIFREKNTSNFDYSYFNIAIHIRRFNNKVDKHLKETPINDEIYIEIIKYLRTVHQKPMFHIYSQGNIGDFQCYQSKDVIFHINESLEKTFVDMVFADALVVSPSALSYTAALLSNNVIYYIPHCHKPLNHWYLIQGFTNTFRDRYEFIVNKKIVYYDSESETFYQIENNKKKEIDVFELLG